MSTITDTMPLTQLHQEGPEFSRLVFGFWRLLEWQLSVKQRQALLEKVLALGITTVDHADIYGDYQCETLFGEVLKQQPHLRENIQVVTKCGIKLLSANRPSHEFHRYDTGSEHILLSAENSLRALNVDVIDLLLIHRPDIFMDPDEVASAFTQLKEQGKVKHFGVSNHLPHQFQLLQSRLDFPLSTNQLEISVLHTEAFYDGSISQCQERAIAPMAWSPLAGGRLFTGIDEQSQRVRLKLEQLSEIYDASVDQLAIAWLCKHPSGILPVIGSGNISRIEAATKAVDLNLSKDHWFEILAASEGHEVP